MKQSQPDDNATPSDSGTTTTATPPDVAPISFVKLFTFATTTDKLLLALGVLAAVITGAALPSTSIFFGNMIDAFAYYQSRRINEDQFQAIVNTNALYFIYISVGVFITTYIFMSTFIYVGGRQTYKIRSNYLSSVLRQEIAWFDKLSAGEVATRITSDTSLIQDGVSEKIPLIIHDLSTFLSGFIIAFTASWRMTLVILCIIPAMAVTIGFLNYYASRYATQALTHYSDAGTLAEETIVAIRTAMAFNQQKQLEKLYTSNLNRAERAGLRKSFSVGVGVACIFFIIYCGYSLAFYYGGTLILEGTLTSGKVVNVFFAVLIGAFSLGNIAPNLQTLSIAKGAGAKIFHAIDRTSVIDANSDKGERLEKVSGKISFENIVFNYPSRPDVKVFSDFSLDITPGTTVALVGASGSGKSTIVQLLERFYDPTSGVITLDGHDIKNLNLKWLRQQIGLVSQEPTLFSGTIAQNIATGLIGTEYEGQDIEQQMPVIKNACINANAHEFIEKLPLGYSTQVGERGFLLSGGQKQRIAIARAIVKDPRILLLDEATSALDTQSEAIVQEALDRARQGRTTIVVAHRLSTIKDADSIVVLEKGCIVEKGTHTQLIQQEGHYHRLVKIQNVDQHTDNDADMVNSTSLIDDIQQVYRSHTVKSDHSILDDLEGQETIIKRLNSIRMAIRLFKINKDELYLYVLGTLGALVLGMIYPLFSLLFSGILEVFQKQGSELRDGTNFWALIFLLLAVGAGVATLAQIGCFGISAEKLTTKIRILIFKAILRQEAGWFDLDSNSTGAITSMLSTQAQDIQGLSGVTLGTLAQLFTNLFGSIIIGLVYGWKLALAIIATLPVIIAASYFQIAMSQIFQKNNKKSYVRSAELACEATAAVKTVAALTKENDVAEKYEEAMQGSLNSSFRNAFVTSLAYAAAQAINILINSLGFWYGATLFRRGELSYSDFFVVFFALVIGCGNIGRSLAYGPDVLKAYTAAVSLFSLLDREPRISDSLNAMSISDFQGQIEFKDVEFCYPIRPNQRVLRKISFTVQPGKFVALVGQSGCGKSTTVSLLERFYDVSKGQILIDGKDIRDYSLKALRDQISIVSQEPHLYDLSVRENIVFGACLNTVPSQEDIEAAARSANIHDFICSLPDGYDTRVGGKGSQLSGGQKQRIAIARALIRHPKILLLDEATSALDADSETIVQAALESASQGRTTVAIAHRLSTIQKADCILVFHNGQIVERGSHQELLELRGRYYKMVGEQVLTS